MSPSAMTASVIHPGAITPSVMSPQDLLAHHDAGTLWPSRAEESDMALAYQTAHQVRALRIARGEQPRGYKIGFTNRSIWPRYNVFAPIWGTVWDSTLSLEVPNATSTARSAFLSTSASTPRPLPLSLAHMCQPRIEPELVFSLRATPPANASLDELFDTLDWLAPGFEIVQSHRLDWRFEAVDTVADSGLHAHLRVGQRRFVRDCAVSAAKLDPWLATARVELRKDEGKGDQVIDTGTGANVLDSPLRALQYFVRELAQCPGAAPLRPGDVVTTGTWTDAWPVLAGEAWAARFSTRDGSLGEVQIAFA